MSHCSFAVLSSELSQCSAIMGEGVLHRSTSVDESVELKESFSKEKRNSFPKEGKCAAQESVIRHTHGKL